MTLFPGNSIENFSIKWYLNSQIRNFSSFRRKYYVKYFNGYPLNINVLTNLLYITIYFT